MGQMSSRTSGGADAADRNPDRADSLEILVVPVHVAGPAGDVCSGRAVDEQRILLAGLPEVDEHMQWVHARGGRSDVDGRVFWKTGSRSTTDSSPAPSASTTHWPFPTSSCGSRRRPFKAAVIRARAAMSSTSPGLLRRTSRPNCAHAAGPWRHRSSCGSSPVNASVFVRPADAPGHAAWDAGAGVLCAGGGEVGGSSGGAGSPASVHADGADRGHLDANEILREAVGVGAQRGVAPACRREPRVFREDAVATTGRVPGLDGKARVLTVLTLRCRTR